MNEAEQIRISMDQAKECIALRDALVRLESNPDFELIFREEFFKNEAVRLVHLKSDPQMRGEAQQKGVENGMIAVGYMAQFFNKIHEFGSLSENALEDGAEELAQLDAEEQEEAMQA